MCLVLSATQSVSIFKSRLAITIMSYVCMHSLRSARILEPIVTFVVSKAAAGGEEELGEGLRLLF